MGGQCMTNQFSVDSKASFFAIFGGQFLDLQNAMKFGDVSKVLPSFTGRVAMASSHLEIFFLLIWHGAFSPANFFTCRFGMAPSRAAKCTEK